ncbi:MAG: phage tail sheath subtilisin-like domain-containing protein [Paracoccaceae bacterium]
MPASYLHGIDAIEIDDGLRPIRTVRSSVIAVVGTAPDADDTAFPEDRHVLVASSRTEAAPLGATGTLPAAMRGIFDQAGAVVVVRRVAEGADAAATQANVIAAIEGLVGAEAETGAHPRIVIAPGFSANTAVATALVAAAERLRAIAYIDGPDTDDAAAIAYRGEFGSPRAMVIDPWVTVFDAAANGGAGGDVADPPSARVAGLTAKIDADRGFWWAPSNQVINGITGTTRTVDFNHGDENSRANLLNEGEVTTIVRSDGYRLWGLRSTSSDPLTAFLTVQRTIDMVVDSSVRAHRWALDRPFSQQLLLDVRDSVQAYIDQMVEAGALLGGMAWIDPEANTEVTLKAGQFFLDFDLEPPAPVERITFRVRRNGAYYEDLIDAVASAA